MDNCGVYYFALGDGSMNEAVHSAMSVKNAMPGIRIAITTDQPEVNHDLFDEIIPTPSRIIEYDLHDLPHYPCQAFLCRTRHALDAPFEHTLFLDADTYVTGNLYDVFELVSDGRYHLAMAPTCNRWYYKFSPVPKTFTSLNCGFMLYRRCAEITKLADQWYKNLSDIVRQNLADHWLAFDEEEALGLALWQCPEVKTYVLPNEYNFQNLNYPGFALHDVKVLHGHGDLETIAQKVNASPGPRVWDGGQVVWRK